MGYETLDKKKTSLAEILAGTLLHSETVNEELIKLVWDRMSDEQKNALTDAAFHAAHEKLGKIVESRIYGIGSRGYSDGRPNLFARHIETAVKKAFDAEKMGEAITAIVHEQLSIAREGLRENVRKTAATMMETLMESIISHMDLDEIQNSLRASLREAFMSKGEKS